MKVTTFRIFASLVVVVSAIAATLAVSAKPQDEPKAVLVKSSSPEVAKAISDALAKSEFGSKDYRVSLPKSGGRTAIARGSLSKSNIVQLERQVKVGNKDFGRGSGDIIILVKVITKGSAAERLVREALQGIDSKQYQIEVVR